MPRRRIDDLEVVTRWIARCGDDEAEGETEGEAVRRLLDDRIKLRIRVIADGRTQEEWVTRRQLEFFGHEIIAHAKMRKWLVIIDHPASSVIHVFAY